MPIWIFAAVLFGMVVLVDDSYDQAVNEAEHTRYMVCSGFWPPEVSEAKIDCTDFVPDAEYAQEVR